MKFNRDEYIALMTFGQADRPMFVEPFGLLIGLGDEWRAQGASEDELRLVAFDWDYVPYVDCGGNTGTRGGFQTQTMEDHQDYIIQRDYLGRTTKLCKGFATMPLPLDYPVKTMDDWLKFKPLYEFHEDRINWDAVAAAAKAQASGALVVGGLQGGYSIPRELMGAEGACVAYYEQPELMQDILQTMGDTAFKVYERITDRLIIDQLSVGEDMAGKSGPLVGPAHVQQFLKPYYRKVWDLLRSKGARIFVQDSDGNLNPIVDALLDCGLTCMYPMEPAAGMDIVQVRMKYGTRLAMLGGIDKHVLRSSKQAIRKELEYKMQPLMRAGGMVYGLDHRIPNGTPLDHYRYYVDLGREILGLPPRNVKNRGWQRMAF